MSGDGTEIARCWYGFAEAYSCLGRWVVAFVSECLPFSFDMVHFGHANLVRQAKCLGDYLIAGIHSDEEITRHKGPPVFTQEERYILLKAIKWVDEVVKDAPYMTQLEVLQDHNCDFCVHGNDISFTENGSDAYEIVKKAGKYAEVSRTEGISTTDLLYRILRLTRHCKGRNLNIENGSGDLETSPVSAYTSGITHYMPNALRIAQFMSSGSGTGIATSSSLEGIRARRPGERVVYAPGAFDLMHVGHVQFLEKCRQLGTYLIVGLHSDESKRSILRLEDLSTRKYGIAIVRVGYVVLPA
ncbi:Ethanolamine-phosphate cytidylyltransferase [Taenia solium]|eukprot:TsM_000797000 transcript=TsM_000797000 gene=TsM_000797000